MPDIILFNEPATIQGGDTVKWKKTLTDFPAPTWTLKYYLVKTGEQIVITAVADGTDHSVVLTKATTAAYKVGTYSWQAFVDDGTERFKMDEGAMEVLPDFETQTTGFDNRSIPAQMVDAFEALFTGKITRLDLDKTSYSIANRSITKLSVAELRVEYLRWKADLKAEQDAEKIATGLPTGNKILTRFVR